MPRWCSARLVVACGLLALLVGSVVASERSARAMAGAASAFLSSLTPQQRAAASLPFEGEERMRWAYVPTEIFPRKGLILKDMTEPQRKLAHDLLKTGLSQSGYMTATSIMELEIVLGALEDAGATDDARRGAKMIRDPLRYFFSVFGTPGTKGVWGWRVDGHHISVHFTVVDGSLVAGAPTFFGSNPAEVRSGPKTGLRILGGEEDAGRALLMALDPPRRAKAVLPIDAPGDIITKNKAAVDPLAPAGITAAELTPAQRDLLMKVVDAYSSMVTADVAADRMAKITKAGVEKIAFAWAGEAERGKKHYYRVQGPTFLIEFDNTQDDANHVHSVWRDFDGDFGADLLREHVSSTPH